MKLTVKGGAAVDPDSGYTHTLSLSLSPLVFFTLHSVHFVSHLPVLMYLGLNDALSLLLRSGGLRSRAGSEREDLQRYTGAGGHRPRNKLLLQTPASGGRRTETVRGQHLGVLWHLICLCVLFSQPNPVIYYSKHDTSVPKTVKVAITY